MTKSATTQLSSLQLLAGINASTRALRSLAWNIALSNSNVNREALVCLRRQRTIVTLSRATKDNRNAKQLSNKPLQ